MLWCWCCSLNSSQIAPLESAFPAFSTPLQAKLVQARYHKRLSTKTNNCLDTLKGPFYGMKNFRDFTFPTIKYCSVWVPICVAWRRLTYLYRTTGDAKLYNLYFAHNLFMLSYMLLTFGFGICVYDSIVISFCIGGNNFLFFSRIRNLIQVWDSG